MMGLSDGWKSVRIGLAVLIQYRSVTDTQPAIQPATQSASHVAVAITLNAQASSLKTESNHIKVIFCQKNSLYCSCVLSWRFILNFLRFNDTLLTVFLPDVTLRTSMHSVAFWTAFVLRPFDIALWFWFAMDNGMHEKYPEPEKYNSERLWGPCSEEPCEHC